jgi:hypothetical protein
MESKALRVRGGSGKLERVLEQGTSIREAELEERQPLPGPAMLKRLVSEVL